MLPPIVAQNGSSPFSVFYGTVVGPGMNLKKAGAFGATIAENLDGPPAFKIAATPDADLSHVWQLKRAVHPSSTSPSGRPNIPIGMVVEVNQNNGFGDFSNPQPGKMMEVAGTVEQETGKLGSNFVKESFDQSPWCRES